MVDVMESAKNPEPLKKWDKLVKRNANGQFERGSKALAGAGRPPGSLNKTTLKLREAILSALDKVGGDEYLAKLAIENSSAFASLLGKVLPTTLTSESDGGNAQIVFTRVIVRPGDPPKDSNDYLLTNRNEPVAIESNIKDLDESPSSS